MKRLMPKSIPVSWWVLMSLLVSMIFGFYHLAIPKLFGNPNYSPLTLNTNTPSFAVDETIAYATKTQEVLSGHIAMSDLFIFEYKDSPSPLRGEIVPALIAAGLAKLGGGMAEGFILADFIWPALTFFILTIFFYSMTKKKFFAPVVALMIMFFYNYLRFFPYLPSALKIAVKALTVGSYSHFIRSFHPQISFFFFMLALLVCWQMIEEKKNKLDKHYWWILGILLSLLIYSYFFFWTFGLAFGLVIMIWSKWKNQIKLSKKLIKALGLALILGMPFFINILKFYSLPLSESFVRNVTFKSADEIKLLGLLIVLALTARWWLKNKQQAFFWQSFYLTGIVLVVGTMITGLAIDDPLGHWGVRVIYPLTTGFLLVLIGQKIRFKVATWLLISCLLLAYQARVHWQYFKNQNQVFYLEPERKEVFNWINDHLDRDTVILTSGLKDNLYLSVYTHANVFIPRSQHSLAPDTETLERFLLLYKIVKIPIERVEMMFSLTENNQQLRQRGRFNFDDCGGHYLYFRRFIGKDYYNCSVSSHHLNTILKNYKQISGDLNKWQQKYRMDYWLWGLNEKEWAKINPDNLGWQLVWKNQDYQLFKLF
ncbi:hypothetical protein ACFL18_00135 [Patescibacteria group bacterium]